MSEIRSKIVGCGSYLPERIIENQEMADLVDTSDDWIVARTGIKRRHIAADGELTSELATKAAKKALLSANISGDNVDLIVVATATPDQTFPATATRVQFNLGLTKGFAFDVQAVCSGFVYALSVADNFIRVGQATTALVIGAETFSRILDWEDRTTCVLFGDGAGAVVLTGEAKGNSNRSPGILASKLCSDGRYQDLLYVDGGPSSTQTTGVLKMSGKEVFKHAVNNLSSIVNEVLEEAGLRIGDIDWVVPHQANKRILDATSRKLKIDPRKVIVTVGEHANTSAASVPLALDTAVSDGRINKGDLLLMEAMGGGFTWGACLVRW